MVLVSPNALIQLFTRPLLSGNTKKATEASESATARKVWLAEAEKSLAEFN